MPKLNKILYATDLSANAKPALSWAMSLAEQYDAAITIINVIPDVIEEMSASMGYDLVTHFDPEQLNQLTSEGKESAREAIQDRIKTVCAEVKNELPSCRLDLNHIIIKAGHPVHEIIAAADAGDFDMVVMGTHGHGFIDELLLGSVARGVVHKSKVPVLTVRLPAD